MASRAAPIAIIHKYGEDLLCKTSLVSKKKALKISIIPKYATISLWAKSTIDSNTGRLGNREI